MPICSSCRLCCCRGSCDERNFAAVSDDAICSATQLSSCCSYWSCSSPANDAYPTSSCWTATEHASALCVPAISVWNTSGKMLHTIIWRFSWTWYSRDWRAVFKDGETGQHDFAVNFISNEQWSTRPILRRYQNPLCWRLSLLRHFEVVRFQLN